jgi:N-methylhydantoinase B
MASSVVDPLTLSVVRHKLQAIAEEMVETMTRTCFPPILNQNQDFSAVVHDSLGRTVAQAERVPIHMGAMSTAIREMALAFAGDIHPSDILIANDPYAGGSHLPDITMAKPVFTAGTLRLWVSIRAHQGDIGGLSAGGYSPGAREIWHEGLRIPPLRLVDEKGLRQDVLALLGLNSRKANDLKGDLMAQIAAVEVGARRLEELIARYGADEIAQCAEAILDAGAASMRALLARCRSGTYKAVGLLEGDAPGVTIELPVTIRLSPESAEVDLSDCPDQVDNFLNSPIANTRAAVNVALLYLLDDTEALNYGSADAIHLVTREGSLVHPREPAPVAACTSLAAATIIEAVLMAMAEALPENAICGFARRFRFVIASEDATGAPFIWHSFFNRGGAGAFATGDGWPNLGGIHNPGGTPSPSIERTESSYPLTVEAYELRPDSGGDGQFRGGLGGRIVIRYNGENRGRMIFTGSGTAVAPYGLVGGHAGQVHACEILRSDGRREALGGRESEIAIDGGDRIVCLSAGGGGYGRPDARSLKDRARDVEFGYASAVDGCR